MSSPNLEGKSVIITGGCSGLGLAIAEYFGSHDSKISILDFDKNGDSVIEGLRTRYPSANFDFYACDVTSWETQAEIFKRVWEKIGSVDYVFPNAGIAHDDFYKIDEGEPIKPNLRCLDVCSTGCIYTVHLGVHYMRRSKEDWKGMIICTASDAGLYGFYPAPIYGTAKHGVVGLVRSMGAMLKREGIMINALAPNYIRSNLSAAEIADYQILTPMSSVVKAVEDLVSNSTKSGMIAEVSGDEPGFFYRDQIDYVDETTVKNFNGWWELATGTQGAGNGNKVVPGTLAELQRQKAESSA